MTFRRLIPALLFALTCAAQAQTVTGSLVSDPAVPTIISPATNGNYYVLNKDLSLSGRYYPAGVTCPAPAGLSAASATQRTLLNDGTSAYVTAQSTSANAAATTYSPGTPCSSAAPLVLAGGTPTQTFTTNNPRQGVYNVLQAFNGNGPDTLTVVANLNTNTSSTPTLTKKSSVTVDTGGTYTAMLTDINSSYGNTIITELRTATSPGGLFVYSPGIQTVFKILGPGGVPLPAIGAFIIPAAANDNGDLLVLVNQDNLTATNQANPPVVLNPFTIIDLGQLQRAFVAVLSQGTTITLPAISQIPATTPYYAMLGAQYSPVFHLLYALVAGGTSSSSVTQSIIRYDPTNPLAPAETVVADVSNIPFTLGTYPQLALNAAAGTMEILSQGSLYHVTVAGKNNTALAVAGNSFGDNNFKPTYIATNPLLGETYIASSASVDIFSLSGSSTKRATIELYGQDNAIANQTYQLYANGINPDGDSALSSATITFTATPAGGSPIVLATVPFSSFNSVAGSTNVTFPAAGIYTIVASAPATTNYPAFSSLPLTVGVGATGVAAVYPTGLRLIVPQTSSSTSVTASLYLTGSTYAPTGRIVVTDATGSEVGRFTFTGGATSYPVTATLTLPQGASTLTALYNGDSQNKTSTSNAATITVGTVAKVTPAMSITLPSTASPGATVNGTLAFTSSSTSAPTGNITVTQNSTAGVSTVIATIPAAQAAVTGGKAFTFTAPTAADSYNIYASYDGDTNFNLAFSPTYTLKIAGAIITTTTSLSAVATATAGTAFPVTVTFKQANTSNTSPTGAITVQATNAAGSVTILGSVTIAQATASGGYPLQTTLPTPGTYSITATYNGDANYAPSSGTISVAVKGTLALGLTVPANAAVGATLTGQLQVAVTGGTTPTGSYLVTATSATGTTVTLATINPAAVTTPSTNFVFTAPAAGTYKAKVTYAGDANYPAATSATSNFVIGAVNATTTNVSAVASTTRNTPFPITVTFTPKTTGQFAPTGTITVTVTDVNGSIQPYTPIPVAQASVTGGAQVTAQVYFAGAATVSASYSGDTYYSPSTATIGVNILALTGALTVAAPATLTTGIPINVNVKFAPSTSTQTPPTDSMQVTLRDSKFNILAIAYAAPADYLSTGGANVSITPDLAYPATAGGNAGAATVTGEIGSVGSIYALTSGTAKTNVVLAAPTLSVTGSPTATLGTFYAAQLKFNGSGTSPAGSIVVSATGPAGTFSTTVPAVNAVGVGGSVQLNFNAVGTFSVVAQYMGDANNIGTTSQPLTVTVAAPLNSKFVLTLADPSLSDPNGALRFYIVDEPYKTTKLTLTAFNGYSYPVSLSFTEVSGNLGFLGNFQNDATKAVMTTVVPSALGTVIDLNISRLARNLPSSHPLGGVPATLGTGVLSLLLLGFKARRRKLRAAHLRLLLLPILCLCLLPLVTGCDSAFLSGKYLVTATPAANAPDQTVQTAIIYIETQ